MVFFRTGDVRSPLMLMLIYIQIETVFKPFLVGLYITYYFRYKVYIYIYIYSPGFFQSTTKCSTPRTVPSGQIPDRQRRTLAGPCQPQTASSHAGRAALDQVAEVGKLSFEYVSFLLDQSGVGSSVLKIFPWMDMLPLRQDPPGSPVPSTRRLSFK